MIIDININEMDEVEDSIKQQLQEVYNGQQETFDSILEQLRVDIPALESLQINVNEVDGDLLAKIYAE